MSSRRALALLAAVVGSAAQTTAQPAPNVVLLMADDLGCGDTGGEPSRTPELDAMAAAGLRLTRFYSASPVCSPTRGSVLTGRHPDRYGITGANVGHLPATEPCLAELLRVAGYRTGHFGKWHLGTLTVTERDSNRGGPRGAVHYAPPWERGFDVCFSTEAKVPTYDPMIAPGSAGRPYGTAYWTGPGQQVTAALPGDDSTLIVDRALDFVRDSVREGAPFLAVVWFHAPHEPVVADPQWTVRLADRFADPEELRYRACVAALDAQVGRLRRELRELGVADDTLLWFCSDNGPEHADGPGSTGGLRGRKRDLYEGGVRVPAVLEWPRRIPAGAVGALPATTSDVFATVLDVCRAERPDLRPLDGRSLAPWFVEPARSMRRRIGFSHRGWLAAMDDRYKLHVHPGDGRVELFDLIDDPGERRDLAVERRELTAELRAFLDAWRESCARSSAGFDDPLPLPSSGADFFALRGTAPLVRSRRRFEAGGDATVAFLGGSITHNPGWRDLVQYDLRRRFPRAEFRFVNAGIPSFGSVPDAFRFEQDVIGPSGGRLDLLFVDAAVNDAANGCDALRSRRAMEGIVRQARRVSPGVDVVFLYFADPAKLADYDRGTTPAVIEAHEVVARHYGVCSVDLAREVQARIAVGQFDWRRDFRDLHPSDFGQTLYARSIARTLDAAWSGAVADADPGPLSEPLDPSCYDGGRLLPVGAATEIDGFRVVPDWEPTEGRPAREGFHGVPILEATAPEASLRVAFRGHAIGLLTNSGPDAGRVRFRVDGGHWVERELFTPWSRGLHLPWATILGDELGPGDHVLELRVASERHASSAGTAVRIRWFLAAGD
ncbi:MAG: sulfatase-like hydrolase/transferase [Planctomycetes bacterium]|nr:sulfatase-like hydrolase/transferase [Planctomycetota bacterium]